MTLPELEARAEATDRAAKAAQTAADTAAVDLRCACTWLSLERWLQAELLAMTPAQLVEAADSGVYTRGVGADLVRRYGADWLRGLG